MNTSEQIDAIAAAMVAAQKEMRGASKDSSNPHFKSKYADLTSVLDAIREPLTKNDIAWFQTLGNDESGVTCTTRLVHKSGQFIEGTFGIAPSKKDAHGYGSAATYARRYSLMALAGIAPEDDDGNAAVAGGSPPAQDEAKISDDQRGVLMEMASSSGTDMKAFCQFYRIDSLKDLPAARYEHAKAALQRKCDQKEAA